MTPGRHKVAMLRIRLCEGSEGKNVPPARKAPVPTFDATSLKLVLSSSSVLDPFPLLVPPPLPVTLPVKKDAALPLSLLPLVFLLPSLAGDLSKFSTCGVRTSFIFLSHSLEYPQFIMLQNLPAKF